MEHDPGLRSRSLEEDIGPGINGVNILGSGASIFLAKNNRYSKNLKTIVAIKTKLGCTIGAQAQPSGRPQWPETCN
jgi:hypothetical protein